MPMHAANYPPNWRDVSAAIRARANSRCECAGECGLHHGRRCQEQNGQPARWAKGKVVLTVAHLNHLPHDCRPLNLKAMCQRCHLRYDRDHHAQTASHTRAERRGQGTPELLLGA